MGRHVTGKIINSHLVPEKDGNGETIALAVDQTLFQDATGTMTSLQFEALGLERVRTSQSVAYIDHNMLQVGFENADDHLFLQRFAARYGLYFSRAGNGICHQVHLERFSTPGKTLLGADSHTPTCGGMGMLAIGVGGLDVALAMAGEPFYLRVPQVVEVRLSGRLSPWVSAKDIILEVLRRHTVRGGVGKILEYTGAGIKQLTVPERATVANMGAELGATTSIFPSDEMTRTFLKAQGREGDWIPLGPDPDARYDETWEIDLNSLEPLIALPHSPDHVVPVKEVEGLEIDQVVIGSCTNSSFQDMMSVAAILKGKAIPPSVSLVVAPGSRQVLKMLGLTGALSDLIEAGARILECSCGPCIGVGQAPRTEGVSIRTVNRNFKGRSGTTNARVYLVSPEVAAVSAVHGKVTDPRRLGEAPVLTLPEVYPAEDKMILSPLSPDQARKVELVRGPNIKPLPLKEPLKPRLSGAILIKLGNHVTTDDILPGGTKVLGLRSNIPAISEFIFANVDPDFVRRAREFRGGFIVGGSNYGQGSSREHAAIAPMYLGIQAVIAKSFARIHLANLINFGILPLTFQEEEDYQQVEQGDEVDIELGGLGDCLLENRSKHRKIPLRVPLNDREKEIVRHGGALSFVKKKEGKK